MANLGSPVTLDDLLSHEWLVANHAGGFASSTQAGLNTRKYHGLLVAAMSPPIRRMVILSRVEETLLVNGQVQSLASVEYPGTINPRGHERLRAFSAQPYPRWAYQGEGWTLEKSLQLVNGENTVVITYTLLTADAPVKLEVRPLLALRSIHDLMYQWNGRLNACEFGDSAQVESEKTDSDHAHSRPWRQIRVPATNRTPECFLAHNGEFDPVSHWHLATIYRRETERGYRGLEDVWMPGQISYSLQPGQSVTLICSTDPIVAPAKLALLQKQRNFDLVRKANPAEPDLEELVRAASVFVAHSRKTDTAASTPTIHSGFPWLSPSGRDTMIAFTGLLLVPGAFDDARAVLDQFVGQMRGGLLPSDYPDDGSPPLYLGADVSLWFIHASFDYLKYTNDDEFVRRRLLDAILQIVREYQNGPGLGIECGTDGLLSSRVPGMGTSWMNAKLGDWIITQRGGRPVELNALWYNAIRIAAELCERYEQTDMAWQLNTFARAVQASFIRRFWNESEGCCFDVVGDAAGDSSIRPNQLFAASLAFPVLPHNLACLMLDRVRDLLLTPFGMRTLAQDDPNYQPRYGGDAVQRDRAYHQGSAYPWLLGAYVTASVRRGKRSESTRHQTRHLFNDLLAFMRGRGQGHLPELFDGDAPHHPGGALASARSTAELLRAWYEDVLDHAPVLRPVAASAKPTVSTVTKPTPGKV